MNKIALITGASRGLGRNIALHLARGGADVVVTYLSNKAEGQAVVAEIQALGRKAVALQLNVSDVAAFPAFAESLKAALAGTWNRPTFDFLVNNAGFDLAKPFGQFTPEDFDKLANVHFKGPFFLTQTLLPFITDGGRIINTSTGLARFAVPGNSAYASMKGAMEVLTRYLAKELGPRKIAVNIIAPGAIETDFTKPLFESHPGAKDFLASQTALGRVGQPDDIGPVVAFLCSEAGRWINAQRLEVSGGMFI